MKKGIIEELLPDDLSDKELIHYTSADGLKGMISSKKIWCTQIFYLNDIEENFNGWKMFFKVFDSNVKTELYPDSFVRKIEGSLRLWGCDQTVCWL